MKLVVDLRLINASGIGTYIKNVFPSVIDWFEQVVVLGNKNDIIKYDWAARVEIIEFNSKIYLLSEQIKYVYLIPRCDIFWCPHFNVPLLPIRAKKTIVTMHDVNHLANPDGFSFFVKLWSRILYKNAVKKSSAILTVSQFSKLEIIKYLGANSEKIHVVYCGVNANFFSELEHKSSSLNLPLKYLLFVGNVKPHKNLITLLKAYAILDKAFKEEYKLVILGKKNGFITQDREIFDFILNNELQEYIHFTGYVQDNEMPIVYRRSSLFIMPSLYEGFGLPILEAMASGIPVLSSNHASLPEVGGNAVMYFNPLDVKDLSSKIVKMLTDNGLRNELILGGNKRLEKFTWSRSIENHLKVLNHCFER